MPFKADFPLLFIAAEVNEGVTFHLWDYGGHVASTKDVIELGSWLEYQALNAAPPLGEFTLREHLFPGSYENKLANLGVTARSTHIRRGRIAAPKVKRVVPDITLEELEL